MQLRFVALGMLCLFLGIAPSLAQSSVVLTVGLKEWQAMFFGEEIFAAFEAAHPNVDVVTVIIPDEGLALPENASDVPVFMEALAAYASQADLLPMAMPSTSPLLSRAGLFVDMSPLLYADMDAQIEDFYPVMLESLQWDGGTWGLPMAGSLRFLLYNKSRFDALGMAYPDASWTIYDWMNAGRLLTRYDETGNVLVPGIFGVDDALFLAAEYGESLFDESFTMQPNFNQPELFALVDAWAAFMRDVTPTNCCNFNWGDLPITGGGIWDTDPNVRGGNPNDEWALSLYPNGQAGLVVQAYGISSATANPQLAYELLQFMTTSPEILAYSPSEMTARQSMREISRSSQMVMRPAYSPEIEALIAEGIAHAVPASSVESFRYAYMAVSAVNQGMSAQEAFMGIQEQTLAIFAAVDAVAELRVAATIPTPFVSPELAAGEIRLTFGIESADTSLWAGAIADFVAQDAEVGQIVINGGNLRLEERAASQDCFYLAANPIQGMNLSLIRTIDPYLQVDATFNPDDMLAGTMTEVSRDGMSWGLPLSLELFSLWYDVDAFMAAGLAFPQNGWTISEWELVLQSLHTGRGAVFQNQGVGGNYLLMLAAAYGAVPLDSSSIPARIVADAATAESLRMLLDLAKAGLIDYQELANYAGASFEATAPIVAAYDRPSTGNYQPVLFPHGLLRPVSYRLGVGMISAQSPAADACYRWLSFIAQRPELFNGMPAQRSVLADALAMSHLSAEIIELYRDFDAALNSRHLVIIPNGSNSDNLALAIGDSLSLYWLYRAMDNYVLHDGDLAADLLQAQGFQAEFAACTNAIPQGSLAEFGARNQDEFEGIYGQFVDCAVLIDPATEARLR